MAELLSKQTPLFNLVKNIKNDNIKKPFILPPKNNDKKTLVLELDEVLIYSFTPN